MVIKGNAQARSEPGGGVSLDGFMKVLIFLSPLANLTVIMVGKMRKRGGGDDQPPPGAAPRAHVSAPQFGCPSAPSFCTGTPEGAPVLVLNRVALLEPH